MNQFLGFMGNDTVFGKLMTRLGIIIAANLMFVLCSIPVVTVGAGWAAMYYCLMRTLRSDGEINPFKEFWKGFKDNFKQATATWLLTLALLLYLALEWYWCGQFGGLFLIFRLGLIVIAASVVFVAIYIFPTMAAFEASIRDLIRDSIFFAFKKPLNLLVILFFHIFPMYLTYSDLQSLPLYAFIWCLCGFASVGMITSSLLIREFTPYLPEVDEFGNILTEEEIEERRRQEASGEGSGAEGMAMREKSQEEILAEMEKLGM